MSERLTYGSYLKVRELTSLQHPESTPPHHDEMLFIIIHQVYELWFKQLLHELDATAAAMERDDLLRVSKHFRRIHTIQRLIEQQIDVLETMTPQEFNRIPRQSQPGERLSVDPVSGDRVPRRRAPRRNDEANRTRRRDARASRAAARRTLAVRSLKRLARPARAFRLRPRKNCSRACAKYIRTRASITTCTCFSKS